jgi:transcriptional regulator with XRE-family HTH domain
METSTTARRRPQLTTRRRVLIAMDEAGMTDTDLADALGVHRKTIYNWLHADTMRRQHIYAIAVATGVDPDWLEHGDGDEPTDPVTTPLTAGSLVHRRSTISRHHRWDTTNERPVNGPPLHRVAA